jgi:hypothetical protein
MAEANVFELAGNNVQISYSARGPFIDQPGLQPTFTYQDQEQNLTFSGEQLRIQQSEIGTLVSVSLKISVDAGATILTLLLPTITMGEAPAQPFETYAVVTHTFGNLPRVGAVGARQIYNVLQLNGAARFVPIL